MEIIDWVAIFGALAWTPHLISTIKSYFTKPEVRIITQRIAEIGFTTYGPIFNMRIAFSVKNRDVVISNFRVRVTHESGEEKTYEWQGLRQQVMKMHTNDGPIPYEKENSVLAVKLNQSDVEERIIQCQEVSFVAGKRAVEDKAIKKLSYDREQDGFDPLTFLKSQDALDIFNYIKHAFSWKAGKYKVVFELESPESFKLVDNEYEFSLLPIDIEELDRNKNFIEQDYINALVGKDNESFKQVYWNWRNPPIYKKN
ncbi:hypothetical protein A1OS_02240 [Enterovibrio norvegicus]|uniref:hypothetical protein n=1 Tax=Enterovibrio norvegicus TaxID=188144 RepID=UPI0004744647|nr:hypothetical protein [Enterovibrio norvegicus]OEE64141.1 hypothetical protein A1OS_02240 [Enterovibrio norvegicus]